MSPGVTLDLLALALGLGFVAGVNLYAVVLALGVGIQLGAIHVPGPLPGLAVLGDPVVIVLAAAAYAVEFVGDKIAWADGAWDVIHTFVRPLGAALLILLGVGGLDSGTALAAICLCAGAALAVHAGKAGLRLVANTSPEPFCNVALSLAEDAVALVGSWLAVTHPLLVGGGLALCMLGGLGLAPRLGRVVRIDALAGLRAVDRWLRPGRSTDGLLDRLPLSHAGLLAAIGHAEPALAVRCVSGAGLGAPRNLVGFLSLAQEDLVFVARHGYRVRAYPIDLARVDEIRRRRGLFLDRLTLHSRLSRSQVHFFRDGSDRLERLLARLDEARRARTRRERARSDAVAA